MSVFKFKFFKSEKGEFIPYNEETNKIWTEEKGNKWSLIYSDSFPKELDNPSILD